MTTTWTATFTVGRDPKAHRITVTADSRHEARQKVCPPDFKSQAPFRTIHKLEEHP